MLSLMGLKPIADESPVVSPSRYNESPFLPRLGVLAFPYGPPCNMLPFPSVELRLVDLLLLFRPRAKLEPAPCIGDEPIGEASRVLELGVITKRLVASFRLELKFKDRLVEGSPAGGVGVPWRPDARLPRSSCTRVFLFAPPVLFTACGTAEVPWVA